MATIPPWALPPSPLPRYARPGGYSLTGAAANPYAPKPGPLGQMFGWGDNPIYQSLRPLMQDVGYGLLSGQSFQDGLAKGIERNGQMEPWRQQQAVLASQFQTDYATKDSTARNILQLGDAYKDIADAVSNGAMNPKEGWNEAFKRQSDTRAKTQLDERNRANAAFLKDPTLQQLVTSGAIDFKDAYEMETGTGGDFGQAIIPGLDESTGSLVPMRADPRGGLSIAAMPEGIKYAPDALAGARAGGTIDGKTMANARAALPGAEQTVQITLDAVDTLRNDKQGQAEMFNGFNRYFGSTKGTPMANFEVNLNQASGQAFMQARQMLKGGGQITDFEGRRAEAAFSRLSDAASQGDLPTFLAALDDFEMAVTEGYRKLQAVANGTYQPTTSLPGGGAGSADPLNLFGGQ